MRMFCKLNKFGSINSFLYNYIITGLSHYYLWWLVSVLLLFLAYRIPYCYRPFWFSMFLIVVVFRLFLSLFFQRLCDNVKLFFRKFLPIGTPAYICPLVCIAERVRFIIRPVVLILRPFINIRLGCYGAVALCKLCLTSWLWLIMLFVLFFYEVFVAIVHWYIVTRILLFSVDH